MDKLTLTLTLLLTLYGPTTARLTLNNPHTIDIYRKIGASAWIPMRGYL